MDQKDCNPRDANSGSNPNCTPERINKGRVYKDKECSSFRQMKDC